MRACGLSGRLATETLISPRSCPSRYRSIPMIEIIGRQGSHYTRMARLLAHELGVDYTLRPIYDLLSEDPAVFGGNPALKLPALRQNGTVVWGSQNVCRALARSVLGGESRVFWAEDARTPLLMNAHEVMAHTMA